MVSVIIMLTARHLCGDPDGTRLGITTMMIVVCCDHVHHSSDPTHNDSDRGVITIVVILLMFMMGRFIMMAFSPMNLTTPLIRMLNTYVRLVNMLMLMASMFIGMMRCSRMW